MSSSDKINSIVIVGHDVHAWLAAARLARALRGQNVDITVVEPKRFSFPSVLSFNSAIHEFHAHLGIAEAELVQQLGAVYKYGTRFQNCDDQQDRLYVSSPMGEMVNRVKFQHYLVRAKFANAAIDSADYSLAAKAALENKFSHPEANTLLHKLDYGLEVDGVRYLQFLTQFAQHYGVKRIEASVDSVALNDRKFIDSLTLSNGSVLSADFYFDASGTQAKLIGEALNSSFESWQSAFNCDRRLEVIMPCNSETPLFNSVKKNQHGWQQSIPIQGAHHCTFSYNSSQLSEAQAREYAQAEFGKAVRDDLVRVFEQRQGVRKEFYLANCLALGESAGFIEPLLFTPLDFTVNAIERWLSVYPNKDCNPLLAQEYNIATANEYARVADVHGIIANISVSDAPLMTSIEHRLALFRATGQVAFYESDVLSEAQWVNLLLAFDHWPEFYDPLIHTLSDSELKQILGNTASQVNSALARMPKHDQLIDAIKKAAKPTA